MRLKPPGGQRGQRKLCFLPHSVHGAAWVPRHGGSAIRFCAIAAVVRMLGVGVILVEANAAFSGFRTNKKGRGIQCVVKRTRAAFQSG
mgnify:CR=1 FL=1